jgi:hypothetical protein
MRVSHLKNSIWVANGRKERGKLKAEGSKLKAERSSKVFGERVFNIPGGRGRSWKRMRRRKIQRRTIIIAECGPVKYAPHFTGQGLGPSFTLGTPGLRRVKIAD